MKKTGALLVGMLMWVVSSTNAFALTEYIPLDSLTGFTDDYSKALLKTIAIGIDHRAYMPATPMGMAIGIDVGIDVTAVRLPSEFVSALSLATGQATTGLPSTIPVPKFNIHKGLPMGIDLGFTYASSKLLMGQDGLFSIYGGEVKWAFINGAGAKPAVAARLSGSYNKLWFINTHTYALDALVSKNLFFTDPYFGGGLKYWSGDLAVPISGLPVSVSASHSSVSPHLFGGLPLKLFVLKLTLEADYNFSGIFSYGTKLSLGF